MTHPAAHGRSSFWPGACLGTQSGWPPLSPQDTLSLPLFSSAGLPGEQQPYHPPASSSLSLATQLVQPPPAAVGDTKPSPRPPQIVSLQEVVTGGQGGLGLQQKWVVGELPPPHTHIHT